jgi:hypothetical protein
MTCSRLTPPRSAETGGCSHHKSIRSRDSSPTRARGPEHQDYYVDHILHRYDHYKEFVVA